MTEHLPPSLLLEPETREPNIFCPEFLYYDQPNLNIMLNKYLSEEGSDYIDNLKCTLSRTHARIDGWRGAGRLQI